jgi:hypothetical protein
MDFLTLLVTSLRWLQRPGFRVEQAKALAPIYEIGSGIALSAQ